MRRGAEIGSHTERLKQRIAATRLVRAKAAVRRVQYWRLDVTACPGQYGELAMVRGASGRQYPAMVVEASADGAALVALDVAPDIRAGAEVELTGSAVSVPVGSEVLGRVIDPIGRPLDGNPSPVTQQRRAVVSAPPRTLPRRQRPRVFWTGVRAVDAFVPALVGRRFGILGAAGTGKTLLMRMICCFARVDVVVVGLVGERGREVHEAAEALMAVRPETVIVATRPDAPPAMRRLTPYAATAVAEYFRDQGAHVLLAIDSLTRFAYAQRELGLALGELPATRAYPPSLFWAIPELLERAQASEGQGDITAYYSLLLESEDATDPIAEVALASLDGHIFLSRELATRGVYPAVDILRSLSRMSDEALPVQHRADRQQVREWAQAYHDARDLIETGLYRPGSNEAVDAGIRLMPLLRGFLAQRFDQAADGSETQEALRRLVEEVGR